MLALGVDDGFGNSYFALGDGFDYAHLTGVNRERTQPSCCSSTALESNDRRVNVGERFDPHVTV